MSGLGPLAPRLPGDAGVAAALRAHVAAGLSAAAGRHGFSNRRRRFDAGFTERRRRAGMRAFALASFVLVALLPALLAAGYYGWRADDQFVTETRFLLRINRATATDRIQELTGIPSLEMKRDTQVIADFLRSAALVAGLEAGPGLRARYETAGAGPHPLKPETWLAEDWPARLAPGAPAEDVLEYWQDMSSVEIELPAGIVVFALRSFRAADGEALAAAALGLTEALVNDLNRAAWADAVTRAEALFGEAAERLAALEGRLAVARNAAGLVSAEGEAGMLTGLSGEARAELARLGQEQAAAARHLSPDAPRMRALAARIAALRAQIEGIGAERVGGRDGRAGLAEVMARFAEIEVAREIAERQFLAAARKLEQVRAVSAAQTLYLDVFVPPGRAEEATRPRRALLIAAWTGGAVALWGALCGLFALARDHMA